MILKISILCSAIFLVIMYQSAIGQDETLVEIPTTAINDTKADQIIENLERIIQQNDNSSRSAVISSYIGMMAFLVGLALVIFGLQMSRSDRITPVAKKYYQILILTLILPVIGLLLYAFVTLGATHSSYVGVAALLMIPAGSVLILMIRRTHEKL
jgi:vacuolar-type H+-ATPase subunit I/STV1